MQITPHNVYEQIKQLVRSYHSAGFEERHRAGLISAIELYQRAAGLAPLKNDPAELAKQVEVINPLTEGAWKGINLEQYRGAPMGVADYTAPDVLPTDVLHFGIARIALDKGGYAPDGVYWGLPQGTLWHALATEHGATIAARWFRAPSYAHAVAHVREEFPNATTQRVPAAMVASSRCVR